MWPLDAYPPEHDQEIQLEGLGDSMRFLHRLIEEATEEVIVMGLSQGCALGLLAMLVWDGPRLGAFVGMCGWLPFRKTISEILADDDDDGLFERPSNDGEETEGMTKLEQVVDWIRQELDCLTRGLKIRI
jgi:hypothetical protein